METFRIASRDRLIPAALEDHLQRALIRVKTNLDVAQHSLDYVNEIPGSWQTQVYILEG